MKNREITLTQGYCDEEDADEETCDFDFDDPIYLDLKPG